jgi:hypothetical protein
MCVTPYSRCVFVRSSSLSMSHVTSHAREHGRQPGEATTSQGSHQRLDERRRRRHSMVPLAWRLVSERYLSVITPKLTLACVFAPRAQHEMASAPLLGQLYQSFLDQLQL